MTTELLATQINEFHDLITDMTTKLFNPRYSLLDESVSTHSEPARTGKSKDTGGNPPPYSPHSARLGFTNRALSQLSQ